MSMGTSKQTLTHSKEACPVIDKTNKRLLVNSYPKRDASELTSEWTALADSYKLEKIWLWSLPEDAAGFLRCGFRLEGILERNSFRKPSVSLAFYLNPSRAESKYLQLEDKILLQVSGKPVSRSLSLPSGFRMRLLNPADCYAISALLGKVFSTYPTPVTNPLYIKKQMDKGCLFAGVFKNRKLVSMAAAYPEKDLMRCEITDCATLEKYRGLSLTEKIIPLLEAQILKKGDYTLYSLARARSWGINRIFFKLGYEYRGRLLNNCTIAGGFEDMNLWVKEDHGFGININN